MLNYHVFKRLLVNR